MFYKKICNSKLVLWTGVALVFSSMALLVALLISGCGGPPSETVPIVAVESTSYYRYKISVPGRTGKMLCNSWLLAENGNMVLNNCLQGTVTIVNPQNVSIIE